MRCRLLLTTCASLFAVPGWRQSTDGKADISDRLARSRLAYTGERPTAGQLPRRDAPAGSCRKRDYAIEFRWAHGRARVATGPRSRVGSPSVGCDRCRANSQTAHAAKAATTTVPVLFITPNPLNLADPPATSPVLPCRRAPRIWASICNCMIDAATRCLAHRHAVE